MTPKSAQSANRFVLVFTREEIEMLADQLIGGQRTFKKGTDKYARAESVSLEIEEAMEELGLE